MACVGKQLAIHQPDAPEQADPAMRFLLKNEAAVPGPVADARYGLDQGCTHLAEFVIWLGEAAPKGCLLALEPSPAEWLPGASEEAAAFDQPHAVYEQKEEISEEDLLDPDSLDLDPVDFDGFESTPDSEVGDTADPPDGTGGADDEPAGAAPADEDGAFADGEDGPEADMDQPEEETVREDEFANQLIEIRYGINRLLSVLDADASRGNEKNT